MRQRAFLMAAGIAAAFVLGGCTKSSTPSSEASPGAGAATTAAVSGAAGAKTIGVSIQDLQAQFYVAMEKGMKDEAATYGYVIEFTDANRDQNRQTSQVEDFISKHVDAIILTPVDSKAVGSAIVEANNAKIPVFTADIASTASKGIVVAHIASDNVQGGRVAADLMCKALGGSGSIAIIDQPEVTSVQDRVKGFKDELAAKCPGVKIIADQTAGGDQARATTVMDNLLQTYPNLNGVFGINDDSALGALSSVKSAGKTSTVKIVGYDATPVGRDKIDQGLMVGDPQQYPDQIGKLTIDAIHDYFNGKTPPAKIPVAVGSYTGKTAAKP